MRRVQPRPCRVIVRRLGHDGRDMGMGGGLKCLPNVAERQRLAGHDRMSVGIAKPERDAEARGLRAEVSAGLVIGMVGLRSTRNGQGDMSDRPRPRTIRIFLHHAGHLVALGREVRRRLHRLPELLPVVDAGAQGKEAR